MHAQKILPLLVMRKKTLSLIHFSSLTQVEPENNEDSFIIMDKEIPSQHSDHGFALAIQCFFIESVLFPSSVIGLVYYYVYH